MNAAPLTPYGSGTGSYYANKSFIRVAPQSQYDMLLASLRAVLEFRAQLSFYELCV
jgi:hypothetical protein